MQKLSVVACVIMTMAPLSAIAYTQEEADACTPDAFRLCQQAIPDPDRVTQCLVENKRQLSPACKIVFSRPHTEGSVRERNVNWQNTRD
jgi:hypothetical protein